MALKLSSSRSPIKAPIIGPRIGILGASTMKTLKSSIDFNVLSIDVVSTTIEPKTGTLVVITVPFSARILSA